MNEEKALKEELKELKGEVKFIKRALLVVAFALGVIIEKIIELSMLLPVRR